MGGRTLYVADFDPEKRTITNAKPFANEDGKPVWFAYPRWTTDESAIVCHAGGKLYLYTLENGSTKKVSTDDSAKYIYPHADPSTCPNRGLTESPSIRTTFFIGSILLHNRARAPLIQELAGPRRARILPETLEILDLDMVFLLRPTLQKRR